MTEPENQWRSVVNPLDPHQSPRPSAFGKGRTWFCRLFRVGPSLSVELLGVTAGPAPEGPPAASQFSAGPVKHCSLEGLPPRGLSEGPRVLSKLRDESPYLSRPQHPTSLITKWTSLKKWPGFHFSVQLRHQDLEQRRTSFSMDHLALLISPLYRHSQTTS